jgi:hypothetical protein
MNRFLAVTAAVLAAVALHALSTPAPAPAPATPAVLPLPAKSAPAPQPYFDGRKAPAEAVIVSSPAQVERQVERAPDAEQFAGKLRQQQRHAQPLGPQREPPVRFVERPRPLRRLGEAIGRRLGRRR